MAKVYLLGTEKMTHAGKTVVAQYKELDGYNIDLIRGFSEDGNHSQARISALHNCLYKLVIEGKEIDLEIQSNGGTAVPALYDASKPKGKRFLMDTLLEPIVGKYVPYLADEMEKSFGKYVEPEDVAENPTQFEEPSAAVHQLGG